MAFTTPQYNNQEESKSHASFKSERRKCHGIIEVKSYNQVQPIRVCQPAQPKPFIFPTSINPNPPKIHKKHSSSYTSKAAARPATKPMAPTPFVPAPAVGIVEADVVVVNPPVGAMLVEFEPVGYRTVVLGVMTGTELELVLSQAHGAVTVMVTAMQAADVARAEVGYVSSATSVGVSTAAAEDEAPSLPLHCKTAAPLANPAEMPLVSCEAAACASAGSCFTTASTKLWTSDPMLVMLDCTDVQMSEAWKAAFLLARSARRVSPAVERDVATSWRPRASLSEMAPAEAMVDAPSLMVVRRFSASDSTWVPSLSKVLTELSSCVIALEICATTDVTVARSLLTGVGREYSCISAAAVKARTTGSKVAAFMLLVGTYLQRYECVPV